MLWFAVHGGRLRLHAGAYADEVEVGRARQGDCSVLGLEAWNVGLGEYVEVAPSHRRQSAHPAAIKCIQVHTAAPSLVPRRPRALIVLCCRQPVHPGHQFTASPAPSSSPRRCRVVLYLYILTLTAASAALLYFYVYQVKAPSSYVPASSPHRRRCVATSSSSKERARAPVPETPGKGTWSGTW
eukprot:s4866_g2.t1